MIRHTILPALFVFLMLNMALSTVTIADEQSPAASSDQSVTAQHHQENQDAANQAEGPNPAVKDERKDRLNSLFKAVKEKSKAIKPDKYEVTMPVSTAGARGAETRQADRFAVIWPDADISPLTALVENIQNGVERGATKAELEAQLEDFKKVFPEYSDHELLHELADIIKKEI
jgi:hypothetical protein